MRYIGCPVLRDHIIAAYEGVKDLFSRKNPKIVTTAVRGAYIESCDVVLQEDHRKTSLANVEIEKIFELVKSKDYRGCAEPIESIRRIYEGFMNGDVAGLYHNPSDSVFINPIGFINGILLSHIYGVLGAGIFSDVVKRVHENVIEHELVHWEIGGTKPYTEIRTKFLESFDGLSLPLLIDLSVEDVGVAESDRDIPEHLDEHFIKSNPEAYRHVSQLSGIVRSLGVAQLDEAVAFAITVDKIDVPLKRNIENLRFMMFYEYFKIYRAQHGKKETIRHACEIIDESWRKREDVFSVLAVNPEAIKIGEKLVAE